MNGHMNIKFLSLFISWRDEITNPTKFKSRITSADGRERDGNQSLKI